MIHIHYLLPQMKRIRLMYATVRGGTAVCNWKSNINIEWNVNEAIYIQKSTVGFIIRVVNGVYETIIIP